MGTTITAVWQENSNENSIAQMEIPLTRPGATEGRNSPDEGRKEREAEGAVECQIFQARL